MARSATQNKILSASLLLAGLASAVVIYKFATKPTVSKSKKLSSNDGADLDDVDVTKEIRYSTPSKDSSSKTDPETPLTSNKSAAAAVTGSEEVKENTVEEDDDRESNTNEEMMAELHAQIEEIDKRGKKLFKEKKYLDAAEVFTEALDLIDSKVKNASKHKNIERQLVTLMNNRSAMYEKGGMPDLALVGKFTLIYMDVVFYCREYLNLECFLCPSTNYCVD